MSSDLVTFTVDRLDAQAAQFGGWITGGTGDIYTDPRPATSGGAVGAAVKLGVLIFADPCTEISDGICTVDPLPENAMVLATGKATWMRLHDADDVAVGDMSVGLEGSGEAVELLEDDLVAGGLIIPTSIAFVFGG